MDMLLSLIARMKRCRTGEYVSILNICRQDPRAPVRPPHSHGTEAFCRFLWAPTEDFLSQTLHKYCKAQRQEFKTKRNQLEFRK